MSPGPQAPGGRDFFELHSYSPSSDPESFSPPGRRLSWYEKLVGASREDNIKPRSASLKTNNTNNSWSSYTFDWIKNGRATTAPKEQTGTPLVKLKARLEARKTLIFTITNEREISDAALSKACEWYVDHLEDKIKEAWVARLKPVLAGISSFDKPTEGDIAIALTFMIALVIELKKDRLRVGSVALTDLREPIYSKGLLKDTDDDRTDGSQLIFGAVGWLSHLYTPKLHSIDPRLVSIEDPHPKKHKTSHPITYQHIRQAPDATATEYLLEDCRDQPFYTLIKRLGKTFPKAPVTLKTSQPPGDTWLDESFLNFHILAKVAHIEIEWVENLGQHLEFDNHSRKLKIFRFPSLCFVLLTNRSISAWLKTADKIEPISYYHEILLTYRLLFGSDPRASAQFNRLAPSWADALFGSLPPTPTPSLKSTLLPTTSPSSSASTGTTHRRSTPDPLLPILCGSHWQAPAPSAIYDAIHAAPLSAQNNYNASIHFPFLGARLLELQEHVRSRNANTLGALWHDRRVPSNWWTLWAVIIIGGGTLVLGTTSVALQIGGLVLSKQQVDASRGGH